MCADNLIPQKRRKNYKVGGGELRGTSSLATHSCQATTIPSLSSLSPPRPSPTRHLDLATPFLLSHLSLCLSLTPFRSFHPFSLCLCFPSLSPMFLFFRRLSLSLRISIPEQLAAPYIHTRTDTYTYTTLAPPFFRLSLFRRARSFCCPTPAKFATRGGIGRGASFSPEFRIVGGGDTRHRPRNLFAVCADRRRRKSFN